MVSGWDKTSSSASLAVSRRWSRPGWSITNDDLSPAYMVVVAAVSFVTALLFFKAVLQGNVPGQD